MMHQLIISPGENEVDGADSSSFIEPFQPMNDLDPEFSQKIHAFIELYQGRLAFLPINQSSCNNDQKAITVGEWRTYVRYIEHMQYVLGETETAKLYIYWARLALNVEDALTFMLMAYAIATCHPHVTEAGTLLYSGSGRPIPQFNSIQRSFNMVMGLRGFVHGLSSSMPDFSVFTHPTPFNFIWPREWAADPETDGESSFHYGSSGHGSGTDDDSGPPGVAIGRPPATGLTSYSDTSSILSSDDEVPCSRAEVFVGSQDLGPCHVRRLIQMDNYLTKWHRERRERRAVRRARRWARSKFSEDTRRSDPRYDLIATRSMMLASDMMRKKIDDRNRLYVEKIRLTRRIRKSLRDHRRKVKAQFASYWAVNVSSDDENMASDWRRSNRSFHELYKQVIHSWARKIRSTEYKSNVDKTYDCWLTPVRWVRQAGADCGLAVLAMASRPVLTCEAQAGYNVSTFEGEENDEIFDNMVRTALSNFAGTDRYWPYVSLGELHERAVNNGYSICGEMFSARALALLAKTHQTLYNVRLVERDLLENPTQPVKNNGRQTAHQTDEGEDIAIALERACQRLDNIRLVERDLLGYSTPFVESNNRQTARRTDEGEEIAIDLEYGSYVVDDATKNGAKIDGAEQIPWAAGQYSEPYEPFDFRPTDCHYRKIPPRDHPEISTEKLRTLYKGNVDPMPLAGDFKELAIQPDDPSWALSVVQRLMRGDLVAVCYDTDSIMNPCSTNQGSSAHWALLCGVIVESENTKRNKKRITREPVVKNGYLTGFVENKKKSRRKRYSVHSMDTSDYGDSDNDCKMCKKNIDPIYYRRDEFLHYEKEYKNTYKAYCSDADDEGNDDDDIKKGGDNFNGDSDNRQINNGRINDKKKFDKNNKMRQHINHGSYCRRTEMGSKLNLERDADRVWVIARHGAKGNRYILWSLRELANSNRQLRLPSEKIMRNVVPESILKSKSLNIVPVIRDYDEESRYVCRRRDRHNSRQIVSKMVLPSDAYDQNAITYCMGINYDLYYPELNSEHPLSVDIWRAATSVCTRVPYADFMPPLRERQRTMKSRNKTMSAQKKVKPRYIKPERFTLQEPYYNTVERVTLRESNVEKNVSTESVENHIGKTTPDRSMEISVTPEEEQEPFEFEEGPYMLPEGVRLDRCLARRFVVFEPIQSPTYTFEKRTLQEHPLAPLLCHFRFDGSPHVQRPYAPGTTFKCFHRNCPNSI